MKKLIIKLTTTILLLMSLNSYAAIGGENYFKECREELGPGFDRGACYVMGITTSLPTLIISEKEVPKDSLEYKAISIDQANRTLNGETTLFFKTDKEKAQLYLDNVKF